MKNEELKGNKGITLIALVITIIVLLILAGVAIASIGGNEGIIKRAQEAKTNHEVASVEEETRLGTYEAEIDDKMRNNSEKKIHLKKIYMMWRLQRMMMEISVIPFSEVLTTRCTKC